ncbi:VOC family protein [Dyadobacter pollutisoli]|uniref:VOC family protein n=1 Tax=Dyadobacter pollutisoli TaxID=2910158 RepID=A0A9E8SNL8_9BACT|nr:VOC family protein [Dyadobacter pollutisoli]WAC14504.1 VOC family protein [Dyadobacter pollutisoli]
MFRKTKAFSGFSVDNLSSAKQFYGDILDLEVSDMAEMPLLKLHIFGGYEVIIYEKPNHEPATFTVLNFPVTDIEEAVKTLKERGVKFESYDYPGLKTDANNISRGDGPTVAWFTDPAGNILSVIQE